MAPRAVKRGTGARHKRRPSAAEGASGPARANRRSPAGAGKSKARAIDRGTSGGSGARASVPHATDGGKRFAGDSLERLVVSDRATWRSWLETHHSRDTGVWLVSFKKATGKPRVAYNDAVEEALCFGWIDSVERGIDAERLMQLFTPRKPRSPWSQSNKVRVEKLVASGLMQPAGLQKIEQARRDGSWDAYAVAESLQEPADLKAAFASARPAAKAYWDTFSPSSRRSILWWVHSAKRPETRAQRIASVVSEAAQNRRANFPEDRRRSS